MQICFSAVLGNHAPAWIATFIRFIVGILALHSTNEGGPLDKKPNKVLAPHKDGLSYRPIGRNFGLSKTTVIEIVKREVVQPFLVWRFQRIV